MPGDHNISNALAAVAVSRHLGIGRNQIVLNEWCIANGGHARTGLEDNVRLDKQTLAPSNAALVKRAAELCEKYERPVATWQQAREILGLRAG